MKLFLSFLFCLMSSSSFAITQVYNPKIIPQTSTFTINHQAIGVIQYPNAMAFEYALGQSRGLAVKRGLAFDARGLKPVRVSIANSPMPLDILFINEQKRVTCITEEISSQASSSVGCNTPAISTVLILKSGAVRQFQIQIGDKVDGLN